MRIAVGRGLALPGLRKDYDSLVQVDAVQRSGCITPQIVVLHQLAHCDICAPGCCSRELYILWIYSHGPFSCARKVALSLYN